MLLKWFAIVIVVLFVLLLWIMVVVTNVVDAGGGGGGVALYRVAFHDYVVTNVAFSFLLSRRCLFLLSSLQGNLVYLCLRLLA